MVSLIGHRQMRRVLSSQCEQGNSTSCVSTGVLLTENYPHAAETFGSAGLGVFHFHPLPRRIEQWGHGDRLAGNPRRTEVAGELGMVTQAGGNAGFAADELDGQS